MGVEITAWSVRMCMFIVSKEGTLQLKPFRGALRAWIGPETLFFIREFAADNRSWLPTAEQQFCSLRKWAGESDQGWRWGGKEKTKERNCTGHSFELWKSVRLSVCMCMYMHVEIKDRLQKQRHKENRRRKKTLYKVANGSMYREADGKVCAYCSFISRGKMDITIHPGWETLYPNCNRNLFYCCGSAITHAINWGC